MKLSQLADPDYFGGFSTRSLMLYAFIVRFILIIYSAFHDAYFTVAYTDVDYLVVTDGARHMAAWGSPFDRETYRYTPLLALFFMPAVSASWLGKVGLALADVVAGAFVLKVLTLPTRGGTGSTGTATAAAHTSAMAQAKQLVSVFIWFNPVVLNVSTRGNSDIILAALTLGSLVSFVQNKFVAAGLYLGFAIHTKIYPIIYAAPFVFCLLERNGIRNAVVPIVKSALATVVGAVVPTAVCYLWYGQRFLDEALLYHIGRIDHRHNLSPYWLQMYLGLFEMETKGSTQLTANLLAFVPQMTMLVIVSWILRRNAAHAITIETMLFVAFNKVCTVQYFVWYLPFLPFVFFVNSKTSSSSSSSVVSGGGGMLSQWKRPAAVVMAFWVVALLVWMLHGKKLEFDGEDTFSALWLCSCLFLVAQVAQAGLMLRVALWNQHMTIVQQQKPKP